MTKRFDKDAWIKHMLKWRYLIPKTDGRIMRAVKLKPDGSPDFVAGYAEVKVQTHKKTGRVYFNCTWMGHTKSILVNRIIAWAFLPNPDNLPQVNHIDGVKANNAVDNLEWASGSDNEKHAHRTGLKTGRGSANSNAKLTVSDVHKIRSLEGGRDVQALADRFGVSRSTIINILNRRTWRHV